MKYSEFKAEVEKLYWCVTGNKYEVYVLNHGGGKLMVIDKTDTHMLDPDHIQYVSLTHEDKSVLLYLSVRLAKTPLAEREEEKRYWLRKIPVPLLDKEGEKEWFWKYTGTAPSNTFGVDTTKIDSELYKTIFTESEIAKMDITGFEKEPVE